MVKSIFFKICSFLILIIFLDQSIGLILKKLYFRQKNSQSYSLNYTIKECKSDIIIFGNSRAQHHYNSKLITDSLKMSCYNAGIDGGYSILLSFSEINLVTERYTPKMIILELDPEGLILNQEAYDRLSFLLPFYKDYPSIRNLINLRSPFERIKFFSSIYPFNSILINTIIFNTNIHAARKQDVDGYIPLKGTISKMEIQKPLNKEVAIDSNMVNSLTKIIKLCKDKKIALVIINSPKFHLKKEKIKQTIATNIFLDIVLRNNVLYKNFENENTFIGRSELFKDKEHLNSAGARIFSSMVACYINNNLR